MDSSPCSRFEDSSTTASQNPGGEFDVGNPGKADAGKIVNYNSDSNETGRTRLSVFVSSQAEAAGSTLYPS